MATKQIPYGLTDFERIRTANYYYVDKTRYIAEVERNASFFFLSAAPFREVAILECPQMVL